MTATTSRIAALTAAALLTGTLAAGAQTPAPAPASEPSTLEKIGDAVRDTARQAGEYVSWLIPYDLPEVQPNGDILIRRDRPDAATPSQNSSLSGERPAGEMKL